MSSNVRISWYHYGRKNKKEVECCCFTLALYTDTLFSPLWNESKHQSHVNTSATETLIMVLISCVLLCIDESGKISTVHALSLQIGLLVELNVIRKSLVKNR